MRAGTEERIGALLERGAEQGSLPLSDIEELVAELDLDEEAVENLYERLDAGGVRVVDDEGQVAPPPGRGRSGSRVACSTASASWRERSASWRRSSAGCRRRTRSRRRRD